MRLDNMCFLDCGSRLFQPTFKAIAATRGRGCRTQASRDKELSKPVSGQSMARAEIGVKRVEGRLPPCEHLEKWTERNPQPREQLAEVLSRCGVVADLSVSNQVTRWAYSQAEAAGAMTWVRDDEMVPLEQCWKQTLLI